MIIVDSPPFSVGSKDFEADTLCQAEDTQSNGNYRHDCDYQIEIGTGLELAS